MTELLERTEVIVTGTMSVMDDTGDTKVRWDRNNPDEVAAARRTFTDLKAKGYLAYQVAGKGKGGEKTVIQSFDPEAERIVLAKPLVGG